MIFPQLVTERHLPGGGTTTLVGGTPDTGGGTPFRPVLAEFNHRPCYNNSYNDTVIYTYCHKATEILCTYYTKT